MQKLSDERLKSVEILGIIVTRRGCGERTGHVDLYTTCGEVVGGRKENGRPLRLCRAFIVLSKTYGKLA